MAFIHNKVQSWYFIKPSFTKTCMQVWYHVVSRWKKVDEEVKRAKNMEEAASKITNQLLLFRCSV